MQQTTAVFEAEESANPPGLNAFFGGFLPIWGPVTGHAKLGTFKILSNVPSNPHLGMDTKKADFNGICGLRHGQKDGAK